MLKTLFNPDFSGKKIFFILIASFLLSSLCLAGEWNLTGNLNQGRECFCSVMLNDGRVLVAGGWNSGELSSCEIYNPNTGQWSTTDSLSYPATNFTLTKLSNGKILAVYGAFSEIFDPETEIWGELTTLNFPRTYQSAVLLQNGKVLVVGGDAANNYKGCEIYDPETNEWTLTGFCSYPKLWHTLELLSEGRVMAIGGGYEGCEIYNPDTEIWTEIDDLNEPRYRHTSHLLPNGNIMAIAGRWGNHYNSSCEIYDFQTQQWTYTDSLEIGRTNHCSEKLLNNKILVMGGHSDQIGTDTTCEIYNSETNEWQMAASFNASYYNFSSEILNDERVLVMKSCSEIYTWNYTPTVTQPQGIEQAVVGDILTFSVTASDPDNDSIAVRIDWDDNEVSEWTELQPSGTTFELSHSWSEPGQYQIRAQTADQWYFLNPETHNSLSNWSQPLIITITGHATDLSINSHEISILIYPNPFQTSTTISFSVTQSSPIVSLEIYNIKGQKVRNLECDESHVTKAPMYRDYFISWYGRDDNNIPVSSGIYFCKILIDGKSKASRKMLLLK